MLVITAKISSLKNSFQNSLQNSFPISKIFLVFLPKLIWKEFHSHFLPKSWWVVTLIHTFVHCWSRDGLNRRWRGGGGLGVKANRSCSSQYQFLDLICYKMYFGGFFSQKGLILILTKWSLGWPNRFIILQKPE